MLMDGGTNSIWGSIFQIFFSGLLLMLEEAKKRCARMRAQPDKKKEQKEGGGVIENGARGARAIMPLFG